MVGLFGAEPGTWKYDVSKYFHRARSEIKPTAHTVHYLKELSEESLRSRMSEVLSCASWWAGDLQSLPCCGRSDARQRVVERDVIGDGHAMRCTACDHFVLHDLAV